MKKHVLVNILLAAAVVLIAVGTVVYFVKTRKAPATRTPTRPVQKVVAPKIHAKVNYRIRITGTGTARPKVQLEISPLVSGKVVAKADNYLSGKYVRAGQTLFEIEKTDYTQSLDAAKGKVALLDAQLARLKQEAANLGDLEKIERERVALLTKTHENAKRLRDRGAGAQHEVDNALEAVLARRQQLQNVLNEKALIAPRRVQLEAERKLALVDRAKAQTALDRTVVTSPVTGLVLSCLVEVGEHVAAGGVCGEVYGTDIMEVPVSVAAGELHWLDRRALEGLRGTAGSDAEPITAEIVCRQPKTEQVLRFRGVVARVEAGLEAATRMATLIVRVENPTPLGGRANGPPALDRNRFCDVTIAGKVLPRVFVLPREAIQPDGTVFIANDGLLTRRPVKVARWTVDDGLILPGGDIAEGDRVVTRHIPKAVPDMKVEVLDAGPTSTRPATEPATRAAR